MASDAGALADPIRNGENGNVITPGDVDELARVLHQIVVDRPRGQPLIGFLGDDNDLSKQLNLLYESSIERV